jgi:hypothetical protein
MGMHKSGGTKARGRARGATAIPRGTKSPADGAIQIGKLTQASRPQGRGGGKNRGDRRDTSRMFAGSREHTPNFGDPLGSGRKQIQGGGKARRGGGKKQKGTYDRP